MDIRDAVEAEDLPIAIAARGPRTVHLVPTLLKHGSQVPKTNIIRHVVSSCCYKPGSPEHDAVVMIVRDLIDVGASINGIYLNAAYESFPTAIQAAVDSEDILMTRLLLEHGAHPDGLVIPSNYKLLHSRAKDRGRKDSGCISPLALAAGTNCEDGLELFHLLLRAGANVDSSPADILGAKGYDFEEHEYEWYEDGWSFTEPIVFSALQAAAEAGDVVKAEALLQRGARTETFHGTTPLAIAARREDAAMVRLLIQYGADVNAFSERDFTALTAAAARGGVETLSILLESGAQVDHYRKGRIAFRSALQAAAEEGHTAAIKLLLDAGADVNACCGRRGGTSALQGAIKSRKFENIRLLLDHGAHVNPCCISEEDGTTTLNAAIQTGDIDLVWFFLKLGVRTNKCFGHLDLPSPLEAAVKRDSEDIVKVLLEAGADVNSRAASARDTALQLAARNGKNGILQILLNAGADVNAAAPPPKGYSKGHTAVGWAIARQDLTAVSMLVQKGANLSMATDISGRSPLMVACITRTWRKANEEMLRFLLNAGADTNGCDAKRLESPLIVLVDGGDSALAELLITYGADVNFRPSSEANTPLQAASKEGNIELVRKLIDSGADVNAVPRRLYGRTALQAAAERGCIQNLSFLLSRDADVNAPAGPERGVTALQAAAIKGYLRVAQLLLMHGADVDAIASPKHGRTAIDGAAENGRLDMLKYLLDNYKGDQTKMQLCERASRYAKRNYQWDIVKFLRTYSESNGSCW